MVRKSSSIIILILCFGLILMGCPKKTVVKEEPSVKKEEAVKTEAERATKEKESKAKEEFEKGLVAKKTPGSKEKFSKALCSRIFTSTLTNMTSVLPMQPFSRKTQPF